MPPAREPAFNAPRVIVGLIAIFVAIHAIGWALSDEARESMLLALAFIPARYDSSFPYASDFIGGDGAKAWTFVTYAFLHGNLTHLAVNCVWMLAFGSALAWRFGTLRFLLFSAVTAVAGAATHLALHFGQVAPVIGASAAISGHMAAAMRFMFETGGPLGVFRRHGHETFSVPAEPLLATLRRPQALAFMVVWFAANALFGIGGVAIGQGDASIAWEAHIGGFVAGLLLFPLIDPTRPVVNPSSDGARDGLPQAAEPSHDGGSEAGDRR